MFTLIYGKNSPVGKQYLRDKEKSLFYNDASFFSSEDIYKLLWDNDFTIEQICQTIFGALDEVEEIQQSGNGCSKGSFVVVKAQKNE